jgi:hypothetical protein
MPQLVAAIIYVLPIFFNSNVNTDPWLTINTILVVVAGFTTALNPVISFLIVFMILKPYQRAWTSALATIFPSVKPAGN